MFRHKKMDPIVYIPTEGTKLWDRSVELWKSIDPEAKNDLIFSSL
jgi:hypothetical protein